MSLFDRMLEDSNELPPTDQQLAYARELGLELKPGMSLSDVSRLISQAKNHCPPTEEQLKYARELDIDVGPEMSMHDVDALIRQVKSTGLPSEHQIADAIALGISVRDDMSSAEVSALIRKAESRNPSIDTKLELCQKAGLPVNPEMPPDQIDKMLQYARKSPKYAPRLKSLESARREALESKQRERFGDELVDQLCDWKKRVNSGQYLVIYRQGTDVVVDVAIIESVAIKPHEKKPYIQVGMALPVQVTGDDAADGLVWGKDESVHSNQFLHVHQLKSELDQNDLETYARVVAFGKRTAEKIAKSIGKSS